MNIQTPPPRFGFDNSFARELDGFFVPWRAAAATAPRMLRFNRALAEELGIDADALESDLGAAIFAGNVTPEDAKPLAQAYAGHQFGNFSPQLGDGRALLLGEVVDRNGQRRDVQLKGSGRTPFSRGGDGKAAVGPILREYLIGEAMHALGVPTTRALAAVATGDPVYRETPLPGAVLTRVAASHLRVGTFQFFAAREQTDNVRRLADYAIDRHYPEAREAENPYLAFFTSVRDRQARLIADWMLIGFIHGVMNTDNMTISGETIDYGPCAFMDAFSPKTVFSSIDAQGRYAFGNQPPIAQWNLTRLAETLIPLVHEDEKTAIDLLTEAVNGFRPVYIQAWLSGVAAKLGLSEASEDDFDLAVALLTEMEAGRADFTLTFRRLADVLRGAPSPFEAQFEDPQAIRPWLERWQARGEREAKSPEARAARMDTINPIYIPRNHKVEEALEAAVERDDMAPFEDMLGVISDPYVERPGQDAYARPAPMSDTPYKTFCGT